MEVISVKSNLEIFVNQTKFFKIVPSNLLANLYFFVFGTILTLTRTAGGISKQTSESSPYFQFKEFWWVSEIAHLTGNALFGCNFMFYAVKTALEPDNNLKIYFKQGSAQLDRENRSDPIFLRRSPIRSYFLEKATDPINFF